MKSVLVLIAVVFSSNAFSASGEGKAVNEVLPRSAQSHGVTKNAMKKEEAPCADTKEDVLKKLEEKKKAQAASGKGFSLQGATDTGCTVK